MTRGILPSPARPSDEKAATLILLLASIALGSFGLILAGLSLVRTRSRLALASVVTGAGYFGYFIWIFVTGAI